MRWDRAVLMLALVAPMSGCGPSPLPPEPRETVEANPNPEPREAGGSTPSPPRSETRSQAVSGEGASTSSITIDVGNRLGEISDLLYGYNHVWIRGGNGVWDLEQHRPHRPVIEALKGLRPTLLRFPGGTLSHRYRWEQGLGPPEKRPIGRALSHMSTFSNGYGTLEFLEVCRVLGDCEPIIVPNWDEGSPMEAAAWLSFLTGQPENDLALGKDEAGKDWKTVGYWAQRRVDSGHRKPFPIRYFEISNETYWQRFPETADSYSDGFIRYHDLLDQVSPGISIGAVGFHKPRGHGIRDSEEQTGKPWNPTVISRLGERLDFLTVHIYRGIEPEEDDGYPDLLLSPIEVEDEIRQIRALADEIRGSSLPRLHIAITEYNAMIRKNDAFAPEMVNLGSALYNTSLLLAFVRQEVEIGCFHILCLYPPEDPRLASGIHFAAVGIQEDRLVLSPTYYVLSLLSHSLTGTRVSTTARIEPLQVERLGKPVDSIDLEASMPTENDLTVVLVHRDLEQSRIVDLRIKGMEIEGTVEHTTLTAPSIEASNREKNEVTPVTTHPVADENHRLSVELAPASLNVLRFKRKRP